MNLAYLHSCYTQATPLTKHHHYHKLRRVSRCGAFREGTTLMMLSYKDKVFTLRPHAAGRWYSQWCGGSDALKAPPPSPPTIMSVEAFA
jgi:hypothetical protein